MVYYETELYHHGILGQKWGKKNGPPYPLKASKHSSSEKKAGWKKSLDQNSQESEKRRSSQSTGYLPKVKNVIESDAFKRAMKITVAAAVTYGAYQIGKDALMDYGIDITYRPIFERLPQKYYTDTLPKADKDYKNLYFESDSKDAYKVLTDGVNPIFSNAEEDGRAYNCTFCSSAVIMRLKGYDVSAAPTFDMVPTKFIPEWFDGAKRVSPKAKSIDQLMKKIAKQGDGTYGIINVIGDKTGHSMVYCVKNGLAEIIDGQTNKTYGTTEASWFENIFQSEKIDIRKTEFYNLTNCDPTNYAMRTVM